MKLILNGEAIEVEEKNGYLIIDRVWKVGDVLSYVLPMEVQKVEANTLVAENHGKVSLERGRMMLCVEEYDNPNIDEIGVDNRLVFETVSNSEFGIPSVSVLATNNESDVRFKAIPYYLWNNRGANKMRVWLDYYSD